MYLDGDLLLGPRKGMYLESAGTTPTPPDHTYATLNPADKDANISLSGGDLIATATNTARKSIRSTIGISSGTAYFEVLNSSSGNADNMIGVGILSANINTYCGADSGGWSYYANPGSGGSYHNNSGPGEYGVPYQYGDVVGVALDMDNGTVGFYKNGVFQGIAYYGLSGTVYAMLSLYASTAQYVVNFGATPFTYSVPSGYNPGLYT